MSTYDRTKPFVPTVEDPGPVSYTEDGTRWSVTRDEWWVDEHGLAIQAYMTITGLAGTVLRPAVQYVDPSRNGSRNGQP